MSTKSDIAAMAHVIADLTTARGDALSRVCHAADLVSDARAALINGDTDVVSEFLDRTMSYLDNARRVLATDGMVTS